MKILGFLLCDRLVNTTRFLWPLQGAVGGWLNCGPSFSLVGGQRPDSLCVSAETVILMMKQKSTNNLGQKMLRILHLVIHGGHTQ